MKKGIAVCLVFVFLLVTTGNVSAAEIEASYTAEYGYGCSVGSSQDLTIFGTTVSVGQIVTRTLSGNINDPPMTTYWQAPWWPWYPREGIYLPTGYFIRVETIVPDDTYRIVIEGNHRGGYPGAAGYVDVSEDFAIDEIEKGENILTISDGRISFYNRGGCPNCGACDGGGIDASVIITKANDPPVAVIDSIVPNYVAYVHKPVYFSGHGDDSDGTIVEYSWESNIDWFLSSSAEFSTDALTPGSHTFSFKVKDDDGEWSEPVTDQLLVVVPDPSQETEYVDNIFRPEDGLIDNMRRIMTARKNNVVYDGALQTEILESPDYEFSDFNKVIYNTSSYFNPQETSQISPSTYEWQLGTTYPDTPTEVQKRSLRALLKALGQKSAEKVMVEIWVAVALVEQIAEWSPIYLEKVDIFDVAGISHTFDYDYRIPNSLDSQIDFLEYLMNKTKDHALSYIVVSVNSPVDILVTDPAGNKVGTIHSDGSIVEINELPDSAMYTGDTEPEFVVILEPEEGYYLFEILGTGSGTYDFEILRVEEGEITYRKEGFEVPTDVGQHESYTFAYDVVLPATIDIDPDTLNLNAKGIMTAYVTLPEGYVFEDIASLECEGAAPLRMTMEDGVLVAKFKREDLGITTGDPVAVTVTGEFKDGAAFVGSDTIRVISKGK